MKTKDLRSVCIIITLVILVSCQKEVNFQNNNSAPASPGTGSNKQLIGDYDFVGAEASTKSTVTTSQAGMELKAITTSSYISKNNKGTAKITSTEFIFSGLTYSIDTVMHVSTYLNGFLFDETELPFAMTVPLTNQTEEYKKINNDSLVFTKGLFVFNAPATGTSPTTGSGGANISWSGDTLFVKAGNAFITSISQAGTPAMLEGSVSGIFKLKRK
ncbi:MAG: hypothetical protein ACSLE0_17325 [Chitinophagaceae bacterium]